MTNTSHPLRGHNHQGGGFAAADLLVCRTRYGAAPPASRVADALAARRPCGPALDPGASATPWGSQPRAGTGLPPRTARHTTPRSKTFKITTGRSPTEPYYAQLEGPSGDAGMQKT